LLIGSDLQLLNKFAQQQHWTAVFQSRPFEGLWELPGDDVVDVAAGGMSKLKGREAIWTETYAEVRRSALILARNQPFLQDYTDIRRFAAVPGSAADLHARKHLPRSSTITAVSSIDEGVALLIDGSVEAVGTGSVSATFQKRRWSMMDGANVRAEAPTDARTGPRWSMLASVDLHRSSDRVEEIAFAVRNNPLLLHQLNQFILGWKSPQI